MKHYFVAEPGASPHGPYAEAMVKNAYEQGMYPPGTKVWWDGGENWTPAESVFGKREQHVVPLPPKPTAESTPRTIPSPPPPPSSASETRAPRPSYAIRARSWNPINAFTSNMRRYACFEGRSCRLEYWMYYLSQVILLLLIGLFGEIEEHKVLLVFSLAFLLPDMAVSYRRLQDAGYKGTAGAVISCIMGLVGLYTLRVEDFTVIDMVSLAFIIVLGCLPSKNTDNPYGSEPLRPV